MSRGVVALSCAVTRDEGGGELAQQGRVAFDFGEFWFRGPRLGSGQCPVKRYNRQLRDLIAGDKAKPSAIVSHELRLEDAPRAYENFDNREDGWTKVVLHPDLSAVGA